MALRKPKSDEMAPPGGGTATALAERPETVGESMQECVAVGQLIVQGGHLPDADMQAAADVGNGDLLKFTNLLLQRFGVSRTAVSQAVSQVCQVPLGDASAVILDEEVIAKFPEELARLHKVMPISDQGGQVVLFAADPSPWRRQLVEAATGQRFVWQTSDFNTVTSYIEQMYRSASNVDALVATFVTEDDQRVAAESVAEVNLDDQAPVVQLVAKIVGQALRDRSSDIHIEPLDDRLRIRFRIDGHLVEAFSLPMSAHNPLVLAPQDHVGDEHRREAGARRTASSRPRSTVAQLDVRVVVGRHGVRREDRHASARQDASRWSASTELGMPAETYKSYSKLVHAPFGMVICAGPTGAGKTTTLYATLLEINSTGKNVTTIEDPVEYVFPGINQVQTNAKAGLTFATGLKALLRQDPDVILVGEIRDVDTARIAVQSALTGHFVLSSLHGTDSVAAAAPSARHGHRGLPRRLGGRRRRRRSVCCARRATTARRRTRPGAEELAVFRQHSGGSREDAPSSAASAARYCSNTGYHDRIGVYELLKITPEIRRLIVGWATTEELRRLAVAQGMRTMLREAMQIVEDDVTTIPEVVRTLFSY